jgi:TatD DNase family protein
MLVDTHAHLNFSDFQNDIDSIIKNSIKNNVKEIICVGSNLADSVEAITIAKKYPGIVYAAIGIHPQQTDPENNDSLVKQIEKLNKLALDKAVMAIGECGLDSSEAPVPEKNRSLEEQLFLFEKQIELAIKLDKPIIIHSRKTFEETFNLLQKYFISSKGKLKGVFHCYSAGKSETKKVEAINFYFGLDGNLTYDSGLQNITKIMPLEKIVLETDCPFLTPVPYRGLRNEPQNVRIVAKFLARAKGVTLEKVAQITTQNAQNLFKI